MRAAVAVAAAAKSKSFSPANVKWEQVGNRRELVLLVGAGANNAALFLWNGPNGPA